jgi:hypothetical protein
MKPNGRRANKPFTARSLVGMTMGARKRVYRNAVNTLECADVWRGDVVDRKRLRIGERLRPCPGCALCQPCAHCGKPSTCIGLYDACHETQKPEPACDECCAHGCEDGHCDLRADNEKHCDGSGVLPARKAKR